MQVSKTHHVSRGSPLSPTEAAASNKTFFAPIHTSGTLAVSKNAPLQVISSRFVEQTRILVMKRSSLSEELQSESVRSVCELPYPLVL